MFFTMANNVFALLSLKDSSTALALLTSLGMTEGITRNDKRDKSI